MKRDGWTKEVNRKWISGFRYDWDSWDQNPKVLTEKGRLTPNAFPLLLKKGGGCYR